MHQHDPQTVDRVAAAIADSDEHPGYWADLTAAIDRDAIDPEPLVRTRETYRREARSALDAMPQPDAIPNYGPGWYEIIHPSRATTEVVYVHEDGSLYCPDGSANIQRAEFAFAAARNRAHRLVRADAYVALVPVEADHA